MFYDPDSPVQIFFCIDSTASMGSDEAHSARASVERFLIDMVNAGVNLRLGGVKFNEGMSYCDDSINMSQLSSMESFTTVNDFISGWVNNGYSPVGGDAPELQLDALHLAAEDMNAYGVPGRRYVVLITDNTFHEGQCGSIVTEQQVIDELIASGCMVYISLWDEAYQPAYSGLTVNGEFDPADTNATDPAYKYPLTRLRASILN